MPHLAQVLQQEQISFEVGALPIVAQCANGSMRDALSLLEQVIAFGGRNVTVLAAQQILGTAVRVQTIDLLRNIVVGDARRVIAIVRELAAHNADFSQVLKLLQSIIHQMAVVQVVPDSLAAVADSEQILELATQVAAVDLQLYYQTALLGVRDLPYAPDIVTGFEMVALRMLAFQPVNVDPTTTSTTSSQPAITNAVATPAAAATPAAVATPARSSKQLVVPANIVIAPKTATDPNDCGASDYAVKHYWFNQGVG